MRITGLETEYGIAYRAERSFTPDFIARYLFKPVVERYGSSNVFLGNGSRLYLDVGSHPEYATAECDSIDELIAQERAGDRIFDRLSREAEERLATDGLAGKVFLFKNNVDSIGNSYGCHENYLVGRDIVVKSLGVTLLPFLVTRQLLCGAGHIADGEFLLSQRADHMWEGVSSATTRSRPMINTRDEPHADSARYRRLHVIVGDTNLAEPSVGLKVAATDAVLRMLEAGEKLPEFDIGDPVQAIRRFARDPLAAAEIQRAYLTAAQGWDVDPRALDLWERVLAAVEGDDFSLIDREVDWAIKRKLMRRYEDRAGLSLSSPKLRQIDLAFHDVRPGRGLFNVLEAKGLVQRWIRDADVERAVETAPQTTRAALRGRFLQRARELDAPVSVDWMRLKVSRPEPRMVELGDPFAATNEAVDELIDYMESHG